MINSLTATDDLYSLLSEFQNLRYTMFAKVGRRFPLSHPTLFNYTMKHWVEHLRKLHQCSHAMSSELVDLPPPTGHPVGNRTPINHDTFPIQHTVHEHLVSTPSARAE